MLDINLVLARLDSPAALSAVTALALSTAYSLAGDVHSALLCAALPAASVWALRLGRRPIQVEFKAIFVLGIPKGTCVAFIRIIFFVSLVAALSSSLIIPLPTIALGSMALSTTKLLNALPGSQTKLVPWASLIGIAAGSLVPRSRAGLGLTFGRCSGEPLVLATLCVVLSSVALTCWSLWYVKGDHGPIQKALAPMLSPATIVPVAVANALSEELEFRVLLCGGLWHHSMVTGEMSSSWLAVSTILVSAYFAILHVAGGFPSGLAGGLLVFVWSAVLVSLVPIS